MVYQQGYIRIKGKSLTTRCLQGYTNFQGLNIQEPHHIIHKEMVLQKDLIALLSVC